MKLFKDNLVILFVFHSKHNFINCSKISLSLKLSSNNKSEKKTSGPFMINWLPLADPLSHSNSTQSMVWCGLCFSMINVLAYSMFWSVDFLAWSMFRYGRYLSMVEFLARFIIFRGWCFGVVNVSAWSMLLHSRCFRSLREFYLLARLMFQWDQCFSMIDVWSPSVNIKFK